MSEAPTPSNALHRLLTRLGPNAAAPLIAAVVAIVVSSITLLLGGHNPITAFSEMGKVLKSVDSLVLIINRASWYYVAGVAVAIGFKMGLFNIGADGQYRLGALFAAYYGSKMSLPRPIHILAIIAIAMSVGALWAMIPGILKVARGVNEVISTIMLNFVATGITAWLLSEHFRFKTTSTELISATKPIPPSGRIGSLNGLFSAIGLGFGKGINLQGFLVIAILVGIAYYVLLFRSRYGFELRASGINAAAARSAGVNPKRMILITIMLSGAVAGLVACGPLLADPTHWKYSDQFPFTLAFTGLSMALLGRNHPVGIAFAGIVWAGIERATQPLTQRGIPQEIGRILQGSFLLAAVISFEVMQRRAQRQAMQAAADQAVARTAHTESQGVPA
jgi:simple sugar transport system permease protein